MSIKDIQISNNRVAVFDNNVQQSIMFSADSLEYIRTIPIASNRNGIPELQDVYLNRYHIKKDQTFVMLFTFYNREQELRDWVPVEVGTKVFTLDEHGDVDSDKLFEGISFSEVIIPLGGMSLGRPVDYFNKLLISFSNDDQLFLAQTEDILIEVYSPEGEYQHAFYYPHKKIPMTRRSAADAEMADIAVENMHLMDVPEYWSVLNNILIDDENRLWISTIVENFDIYEWRVLEETGELIAKFEWPRDEPIEIVKNGYMYSRESDEETGLQQIVRYRVEMEEV